MVVSIRFSSYPTISGGGPLTSVSGNKNGGKEATGYMENRDPSEMLSVSRASKEANCSLLFASQWASIPPRPTKKPHHRSLCIINTESERCVTVK